MELFVILAAAQAPDIDAWNSALAASHSPATLVEVKSLSTHTGYLPVLIDGQRSGFEFYRSESLPELAAHFPVLAGLRIEKPVVYQLVYHGDFQECAAVFYTASVLVAKFGGTALDTQGGVIINAGQLLEAGAECQKWADQK